MSALRVPPMVCLQPGPLDAPQVTARPGHGDPILKLTATQTETLRRHANAAARRAAESLRARGRARAPERPESGLGLAVVDLRTVTLSEFPEGVPLPVGAHHAVVVLPLAGPVPGTALMALEPHDALRWIRALGVDGDPLGAYVDMGACVLHELVGGVAGAFGLDLCTGTARLREDSLVGVVFGTHAPPDTLIVCARLAVSFGDDDVGEGRSLPVYVYLLVETKLLAGLLPALDPH